MPAVTKTRPYAGPANGAVTARRETRMVRRRAVLTAVVVAALLPVPAGARATEGPAERQRRADAWEARYRAGARGVPVDDGLVALGRDIVLEARDAARLFPAGDLNGDGVEDVIDVRVRAHRTVRQDWPVPVWHEPKSQRLEARSGSDGRLLWTRTVSTYGYLIFTAVGAAGRPGVLFVDGGDPVADSTATGGPGDPATAVTAYDNTGRVAWTVRAVDPYGPPFVSFGTFVRGGGTDLLLFARGTWLAAGPARARASVIRIVDGADGTTRDLLPLVAASEELLVATGPDADGDGLDDVLASPYGSSEPFRVLSSRDARELWRQPALDASVLSGAERVPDVTGDGVADVLHVTLEDDPDRRYTLVDGARGRVLWSRAADGYEVLGDVDRRRGAELAFTVGSAKDGPGFVTSAVGARGTTLWSVRRWLRNPDSDFFDGKVRTAGDLDADGVADLRYTLWPCPKNGCRVGLTGFVDGRTGRVRESAVYEPTGVGAVDGRGADLVSRDYRTGGEVVTAWRGSNGQRLWRTVLPFGALGPTFSLRADRDRCADVVVSFDDEAETVSVLLSGATGLPVWALRRSGDAAAEVTRPAAREHTRSVRTC